MPGDAADYVADISAILYGSLSPREITHGEQIPVAFGYQLQALQWQKEGYKIQHLSLASPKQRDRS